MILHQKGNISMRTLNVDAFYDACLLAFQGVRYKEIGERLNVTPTTISNWAQRDDWKQLHKELREKKRQQVLDAVLRNETST